MGADHGSRVKTRPTALLASPLLVILAQARISASVILAQAGVADVFMLPSHDNAGYFVLKGIGHDIHQQAHISCPFSFTGSRI